MARPTVIAAPWFKQQDVSPLQANMISLSHVVIQRSNIRSIPAVDLEEALS